jgi:hypothetical protein
MDCEMFTNENPLHQITIPVADLVVIEVEGQPILESKHNEIYEKCTKIWDYFQLYGAVIILIGIYGAFILFLIWMFNPKIVGALNDDS